MWKSIGLVGLSILATLTCAGDALGALNNYYSYYGYQWNTAYNGSDVANDGTYSYTLNESGTDTATSGSSVASTTFAIQTVGDATVFNWQFDHERGGAYYSYAYSYGSYFFTSDVNTTYDISGTYEVDGGPTAYQFVELYDYVSGTLLYSYNYSTLTPDEVLQVGLPTGDYNSIFGITTGNIVAGRIYQFNYAYYIHAYPNGDTGATAEGNLNLTIGEPLPEPGTLAIFGIGALCLAACRSRRRLVQGRSSR